jgi:hypothetical protein
VNSSSKGQKCFICREEKGKAAGHHAVGPKTGGSPGSFLARSPFAAVMHPSKDIEVQMKICGFKTEARGMFQSQL